MYVRCFEHATVRTMGGGFRAQNAKKVGKLYTLFYIYIDIYIEVMTRGFKSSMGTHSYASGLPSHPTSSYKSTNLPVIRLPPLALCSALRCYHEASYGSNSSIGNH